MSAIRQALGRLDEAITRLDRNVRGLEGNLAGQQRDMFAAPLPSAAARKLDRAIAQVEAILEEV
ncbi:MAG: hypothetical protein K9G62_00515 [Alphaproteobacteria bacterium]|nr:hypothetical protein [Alphaproteobacteria bacterium]